MCYAGIGQCSIKSSLIQPFFFCHEAHISKDKLLRRALFSLVSCRCNHIHNTSRYAIFKHMVFSPNYAPPLLSCSFFFSLNEEKKTQESAHSKPTPRRLSSRIFKDRGKPVLCGARGHQGWYRMRLVKP